MPRRRTVPLRATAMFLVTMTLPPVPANQINCYDAHHSVRNKSCTASSRRQIEGIIDMIGAHFLKIAPCTIYWTKIHVQRFFFRKLNQSTKGSIDFDTLYIPYYQHYDVDLDFIKKPHMGVRSTWKGSISDKPSWYKWVGSVYISIYTYQIFHLLTWIYLCQF